MDGYQPYYPDIHPDTTTTKSESHEDNAVVLASLLQELSFWEPSTPTPSIESNDGNSSSTGLMRKSRSISDAAMGSSRNSTNRNNHQRLLQHSTSFNGSTNYGSNIINGSIYNHFNDPAPQQLHSTSSQSDNNIAPSHQFRSGSNDCDYNKIVNGHETNLIESDAQQSQQQQPGSPLLAELQARCFWNKAIDPASGRTYYYDIRTRHTQWEKPREIRAIEKRVKKDQRILDESFFREMERNLLSSLARGECIPIQLKPQQCQDDGRHELESKTESPTSYADDMVAILNSTSNVETNSGGRIRTISCMNEHLLAQIQQPIQLQRVSSSNISKSLEGRPPLPSRPPPATTGSINSLSMVHSLSNDAACDRNSSFPITSNVPSENTSSHRYENHDTDTIEKDQQLYFASPNDDYDDLKLSPEESQRRQQLPSQDDVLRGENFLDGALMLADLEVSDDEDGSGNAVNEINGPLSSCSVSRLDQFIHGQPEMEVIASSSKSTHPNSIISASTKPKKSDTSGVSHIRRNTAGEGSILTTHMKGGTMEKPDIDGTIHVVCGVIRAHIEQSCQQTRPTPTPPHIVNINLDIFRDDYESNPADSEHKSQRHHRQQQSQQPKGRSSNGKLPSLEEIKEFYREFYQRSQLEFDAIIMSLIYVERLIKLTNGAVMPTPYNWASVVFSCMVLASKVWDDLSMWNIDFSNVSVNSGVLSSFSLKRINELELSVLACLNFAVAIPGSEYAKYYYLLRNMMIRGGLLDPFAAKQQLSTDTTIRLQDRTRHYQDSITHHNEEQNPRRRVRSVDWTA